jgi:hypothetical protein
MSNTETPVGSDEIRKIIKSQYHASLAMLRETIERCPDELWMSTASTNGFWQIAYHAVFFAHLYVLPNAQAFRPWAEHQKDTQNEDGLAGPPDPKSSLPLIPRPYTRSQVLAYLGITDDMVDDAVNSLDIHNPDCGFPWYKNITKLEHLFISIRHIQHHGGQLADRLRNAVDQGTRWVGARHA